PSSTIYDRDRYAQSSPSEAGWRRRCAVLVPRWCGTASGARKSAEPLRGAATRTDKALRVRGDLLGSLMDMSALLIRAYETFTAKKRKQLLRQKGAVSFRRKNIYPGSEQ